MERWGRTNPELGNNVLLLYSAKRQAARVLGHGRRRLFKVRHCMNIEGIVRELPLFERLSIPRCW